MEVVYLAEQQQSLRRRVALKVIKLGIATREVKGSPSRSGAVTTRLSIKRTSSSMETPCLAALTRRRP